MPCRLRVLSFSVLLLDVGCVRGFARVDAPTLSEGRIFGELRLADGGVPTAAGVIVRDNRDARIANVQPASDGVFAVSVARGTYALDIVAPRHKSRRIDGVEVNGAETDLGAILLERTDDEVSPAIIDASLLSDAFTSVRALRVAVTVLEDRPEAGLFVALHADSSPCDSVVYPPEPVVCTSSPCNVVVDTTFEGPAGLITLYACARDAQGHSSGLPVEIKGFFDDTPPDPPTNLQLSTESRQVTAFALAPPDPESGLLTYEIAWAEDATFAQASTVTTTALPATIAPLENEDIVHVRLRARNRAGLDSEWSAPLAMTVGVRTTRLNDPTASPVSRATNEGMVEANGTLWIASRTERGASVGNDVIELLSCPTDSAGCQSASAWRRTALTAEESPRSFPALHKQPILFDGTSLWLVRNAAGDTVTLLSCPVTQDCTLPGQWTQTVIDSGAPDLPNYAFYAGDVHLVSNGASLFVVLMQKFQPAVTEEAHPTVLACPGVGSDCTAPGQWTVSRLIDDAADARVTGQFEIGPRLSTALGVEGLHIAYENADGGVSMVRCNLGSGCNATAAFAHGVVIAQDLGGRAFPVLSRSPQVLSLTANDAISPRRRLFATCPHTASCVSADDWKGLEGNITRTAEDSRDGPMSVLRHRGRWLATWRSSSEETLRYAVCRDDCTQLSGWRSTTLLESIQSGRDAPTLTRLGADVGLLYRPTPTQRSLRLPALFSPAAVALLPTQNGAVLSWRARAGNTGYGVSLSAAGTNLLRIDDPGLEELTLSTSEETTLQFFATRDASLGTVALDAETRPFSHASIPISATSTLSELHVDATRVLAVTYDSFAGATVSTMACERSSGCTHASDFATWTHTGTALERIAGNDVALARVSHVDGDISASTCPGSQACAQELQWGPRLALLDEPNLGSLALVGRGQSFLMLSQTSAAGPLRARLCANASSGCALDEDWTPVFDAGPFASMGHVSAAAGASAYMVLRTGAGARVSRCAYAAAGGCGSAADWSSVTLLHSPSAFAGAVTETASGAWLAAWLTPNLSGAKSLVVFACHRDSPCTSVTDWHRVGTRPVGEVNNVPSATGLILSAYAGKIVFGYPVPAGLELLSCSDPISSLADCAPALALRGVDSSAQGRTLGRLDHGELSLWSRRQTLLDLELFGLALPRETVLP